MENIWENIGNLENNMKLRKIFETWRKKIGNLTKYWKFGNLEKLKLNIHNWIID